MGKKILGLESAYREAQQWKGDNMTVSAKLVIEVADRIGELENAVIDLRASLRTCQNTSNAVMEQYKDL